ncbi:release factor glutamine methyltransferase [Winogradskyella wandonensis]|uniref:Release factor glutamine methyltransferase n=1 Tax=Winogradskyella wandonensis TaxID=1442586 RepID=A0A4R1KLJ2_9FLAO|nr:peptide chain release factor N(5)-glutamine methyltransferase [Winogradskyella wandonensis]TCK64719.1 release factor glutamine methyltransferase [Winogradskyella wandonensis]
MKALDVKHIFIKELGDIYQKDEAESLFFLCLEHFCDIPRIQLSLEREFTVTKAETESLFKTLDVLKTERPIQYILGETEFFGLKFRVTEAVLIPRQETEELVDLIIKSAKTTSIKILDIGTGSGCIAVSLAKYLPNAKVYALDVSHEALEIAKSNAKLNNVDIHFVEGNILDESSWDLNFGELSFDIIVSNPPYVRYLEKEEIKPNVLNNEPHIALFVSDDNPLLFYNAITHFSKRFLKEHGTLYFEINQYLGKQTKQLLVESGFSEIELKKDINGNDRMLSCVKKIVV